MDKIFFIAIIFGVVAATIHELRYYIWRRKNPEKAAQQDAREDAGY
jgi:hypothetical protein